MDAEREKLFLFELRAHRRRTVELLQMFGEHIKSYDLLVEKFAYETGKSPADIAGEEEFRITWPAHLRRPKKNGNGNGRKHRSVKKGGAELN